MKEGQTAGNGSNLIPQLQVLLPVYNEVQTIDPLITEIHEKLSKTISLRFLVCEDGSEDGTKELLLALKSKYPIDLLSEQSRGGYSQAMRRGMKAITAPYLLCLDTDGQYDLDDFWEMWKLREQADIVVGWRVKRQDPISRRFLSGCFKQLYQALFSLPLHDPSCPFVLMKQIVPLEIMKNPSYMKQGFWWEFYARAYQKGFSFAEVSVNHLIRRFGKTQVYHWRKMPQIGIAHTIALYRLWREGRV